MTVSFASFTKAIQTWLDQEGAGVKTVVRPSTWKPIFNTGVADDDAHLSFSEAAVRRLTPDLDESAVRSLVAALNARFSRPDYESDGESDGESALAEWNPEPPLPSGPTPLAAAAHPAPPQPPSAQNAQDVQSGPGQSVAPSAPPAEPPAPERRVWELPLYDFSRADEDIDISGQNRVPVSVSRSTQGLRYTWPASSETEVYRVVVSDTEDPYSPDDFDEVTVTEACEALDTLPTTTAIRFVTVWAYERSAPGSTVLGQPRRVASQAVVHPLAGWQVSFDSLSRTVEGRWVPPTAPIGAVVAVRSAKIPAGQPVGRLLRGMAWMSHLIENNGAGFQDADVRGGQKQDYVAAVEVSVGGETYTSSPQVLSIVPDVAHEAVADFTVEHDPDQGEGRGASLHISWTQHPLSAVTVYRSAVAVDPAALEQGEIPTTELERAGLRESEAITSAAGIEPLEDGRQRRTLRHVIWPDGVDWDTIHFTPVTNHEDGTSTVGQPVRLKRAGQITNLTLLRRVSRDLLTFTWPGDAGSVELRILPLGSPVDDAVGPQLTVDKETYQQQGGCIISGGLPSEGATIYINSVTYLGGVPIPSVPTRLDVDPLWIYDYQVRWPGEVPVGGSVIRRAVRAFGQTVVEIAITPRVGVRRQEDVAQMVLVYNETHLPLHPADGQRLEVFAQKPSREGGQESYRSAPLPAHGTTLSLWAETKGLKTGYLRLLIDAPARATAQGGAQPHSLESYALIDPSLPDLMIAAR
ncbi:MULTISPECIES: hypothetical protein [Actinomyces]|uniref:Uncharacterized protein n=1 Tax=Actinomyces respiraculi TaxID=2744574 RepID=A0A7T0PWK1_9ACTO|nr:MULTISPECIES: hypothetical protein [Actinomyces]QPL04925.1 hypothetical protein ID810_09255 [Actinomyces respiraculi]